MNNCKIYNCIICCLGKPETPEEPGPSNLLNLEDGNAPGSVRGINTRDDYEMGVNAVAIGTGTSARGFSSFVKGGFTEARADYSNAGGYGTLASDVAAHAEGYYTNAGGAYSHAEGASTTASGRASHAEGSNTLARGYDSHAEGYRTTAGETAHAEGSLTEATGYISHAEGYGTTASQFASHAEGNATTASGVNSHAEGSNTVASGFNSHSEGSYTVARGANSHAEGGSTLAGGISSHAVGVFTTANGYASHSGGYYSTANGSTSYSSGVSTIADGDYQTVIGRFNFPISEFGSAFIIGNGSSAADRSNAFRVDYSGDVHSASGVYTSGADYAEMFEWLDSNPDNEDRCGYFVTVEGEYIRKASDPNDYIIGIVSGAPSIVGNAQSSGWHGMYMRDKLGRVLYEWVYDKSKLPGIDPSTGEPCNRIETNCIQRPLINSAYDSERQYIPRTERCEWAAVGMMGRLRVRDDGSCKPGGFCRHNFKGIATQSTDGYLVLKRIDECTVLIFLSSYS